MRKLRMLGVAALVAGACSSSGCDILLYNAIEGMRSRPKVVSTPKTVFTSVKTKSGAVNAGMNQESLEKELGKPSLSHDGSHVCRLTQRFGVTPGASTRELTWRIEDSLVCAWLDSGLVQFFGVENQNPIALSDLQQELQSVSTEKPVTKPEQQPQSKTPETINGFLESLYAGRVTRTDPAESFKKDTSPDVSFNGKSELTHELSFNIERHHEFQVLDGLACNLEVRLNRKATEDELRKIANQLNDQMSPRYGNRILIRFWLPGMILGHGAWSFCRFKPSFTIIFLGMTIEEQEARAAQLPEHDTMIGRWVHEPNREIIQIHSEKDSLWMERNGSGATRELLVKTELTQTRYYERDWWQKDLYFVIELDGNLGVYDREGLITTARRIR